MKNYIYMLQCYNNCRHFDACIYIHCIKTKGKVEVNEKRMRKRWYEPAGSSIVFTILGTLVALPRKPSRYVSGDKVDMVKAWWQQLQRAISGTAAALSSCYDWGECPQSGRTSELDRSWVLYSGPYVVYTYTYIYQTAFTIHISTLD